VALLVDHGITAGDFYTLDNKPGMWGYEATGNSGNRGGWHWKVRRTRNTPGSGLSVLARK
jgi:hypothetical protein